MTMFAQDQTKSIEPDESWPVPTRLALAGKEVEATPLGRPDALVALSGAWHQLTASSLQTLLTGLAGMWEALADCPAPGPDGSVEVPVLEPTAVRELMAAWDVTGEVTVTHSGCDAVWLNVSPVDGQTEVRLDGDQCWALLRALASVSSWRDQLNTAFFEAATVCHLRAMQTSGDAVTESTRSGRRPATFAGRWETALQFEMEQLLPCRLWLAHAGRGCSPLPGDRRRVELEVKWTLEREERLWLAAQLASLRGVVPESWIEVEGLADVPFVDPSSGDGKRLVWRITDEVSLGHQGMGNVYLTDGDHETDAPALRTELDVEQARRFLQVLLSADAWEQDLAQVVEGAARLARWRKA